MSLAWIQSSVHQPLPPDAVSGGYDSDSSPIYIGRTVYEGEYTPVKVLPTKNAAYLAFNGHEIPINNYEVLCGHGLQWLPGANGETPAGAIAAGSPNSPDQLYIGRAPFQGSITPGKIHTEHGCLYIPFAGEEHSIPHYEVLVQKSAWLNQNAYAPHICVGGNDIDGTPLYVGRTFHQGDVIPAKIVADKSVAYTTWNGQEIACHEFEILAGGCLTWQPSGNGAVPFNAVPAGTTVSGETLYIGRTHVQSSLTVGKIHPSHGCLYIPFNGGEMRFQNYEILVEN